MAAEKNRAIVFTKERFIYRLKVAAISFAIVFLLVLVGWVLFSISPPLPQRTMVMATYPEGSLNAELTKRYQAVLAAKGITLKLVPLAGAVESVARLQEANSGIDAALIPGGITTEEQSPDLTSLGALFNQPLWVFSRDHLRHRHDVLLGSHAKLKHLRVSIGPEGSSSRALSLKLLGDAGVIDQSSAILLSDTPSESAEKLIRGEIDVVIFCDGWDSPAVQRLLNSKHVQLQSLPMANAFEALYPFLNKLVLPAGVVDMAEPRPPTDVSLIATKSSLIVRKDLHPAIQYMLLETGAEIHSKPGMFNSVGQFPAAESIDLPLSPYAREFYKSGTPFLFNHLPFWLAVLLEQPVVWLIPIIVVLFPLLRAAPAIYNWLERQRVYRLYAELRCLEDEVNFAGPNQRNESVINRLDELKDRASRLSLPASFKPLAYSLRWHIDMVREEARKKL